MPQAIDVTVKNAANMDVVFKVVTPSGGDNTPAIWELTAAGTSSLSRPRAEMMARPNADKSARKVLTSLTVPYVVTDGVTGLQKVAANVVFRNGEMVAPRAVPDTLIADAVAYWAGLMSSTLWKSSFQSGYAPI